MSRVRLTLAGLFVFTVALAVMALSAVACGSGAGGKESTTLTTTLSGGGSAGGEITVSEGTKVKDKATLSGKNVSKATGKVKYTVYSDSKCEHTVTSAGEGTVSGETVTASSEETPEAGKTYYWQATYEGNETNSASSSSCTSEVENVKASTSLSTKLAAESEEGTDITVLEGAKVTDKATLSGTNSSSAKGKVLYRIYSDSKCEHEVESAGEESVSGGSATASEERELAAGKTYYWQATYKGDSLHQESKSECGKEVLTVKAKTTLTTELAGEGKEGEVLTILEGSKAEDKAALSGTNSSTAEGKVLYKVYSDSKCEHEVASAGEETVSGGSVTASEEQKLEGGETYYWQATYKGDSLHQESKSECGKEVLTVKAKTTVSTTLSGEGKEGEELEMIEGGAISDRATLSGAGVSMATGTVKYEIYSNPECTELVREVDVVTVAGEFAPSSSEVTLPAGIYYWQAVYSGDGIDQGSTSACGTEITVVAPAVTTSLSGEGQSGEGIEVVEGAAVKDTATLHGEHASSATGTVKYDIYSDPECKDLVTEAGTVSVAGELAPASSEERLTPGMYYWQASYSGDSEEPAAESECETEVALVQTATSLTTSLSGEGDSGSEIEVKEGTAVKDAATLSGTNASTATGYVTYDVYSDSECKELVAEAGDVSVTAGAVPTSEEEMLPPGTYYWQASYSGDEANHSSTSVCGSEISVVTAPVTTSLSGEGQTGSEVEVEEETAVRDGATLHGEHAYKATGTVKYDVYSDPECKDLVAEAGEVTVTSGSVPVSNEEKLSAGTYYWQASYSGDAENPAAQSACGTEIAVVRPPEAQYAALGDSFSAGVGTGAFYAKTNLPENECHRSARAYPARVAEALYPRSPVTEEKVVFKRQPKFIFRACDGAVTENMGGFDFRTGQYNEWIEGAPGRWLATPTQDLWLGLPGGEPPTGPNNAISLVTLTIGGNDAGFATIGRNCATTNNLALNRFLARLYAPYSRSRCKEVIEEWETGVAKAPNTLAPPEREGIPSITTKLPAVLQNIHETAPNARIRIPLYPQLLNTSANGNITLGSGIVTVLGIRYGHATFFIHNKPPKAKDVAFALERFTARLNRTIAVTVKEWARTEKVNAQVVPSTIAAFNGHRLGNRGVEVWVNGVILEGGVTLNVNSMHPTCRGYIAIAERVLRNLGRAVPEGWACP